LNDDAGTEEIRIVSSDVGSLADIRILDLSRVLAGPSCTQLLGDLGADVIKIERPGVGDETRTWGPPFLRDAEGRETTESAYYLSTNRNKRSVTLDISKPEGASLAKHLLVHCDVLMENFKVGGLRKYGLAYEQLKDEFPKLVYCSVTGFGQTGPYAHRPGYDMMAQGTGGIMSITGEPNAPPSKVPVAINDIMTGMYAATAILAALHYRDRCGVGQHIDLGLLDTQVAWLYNVGLNYLTSREIPKRLGTAHPNALPYQVFPTADGHFILGANNDAQFQRYCEAAGVPKLARDPRYSTNAGRVRNRGALVETISQLSRQHPTTYWLQRLEKAGVPCAPVNTIEQMFADPQVKHRQMQITMPHPATNSEVRLIGNPVKLSATPVDYRHSPPMMGQDTDAVLKELLDLSESEIRRLREQSVI
jgi:crotonobetainyl-CoA:carnitine CoA-transferase CaiB-like acyl-CoA transferase